jgi:hypothetical protein
MKITWGTGIVLFLGMFMTVLIGFVIFAWNQDVNMVHLDYYEKGVDYSNQIEKEKRSYEMAALISLTDKDDTISITFPQKVASTINAGNVLFFRPSDHNKDVSYALVFHDSTCVITKENLITGRYIVKITWVSGGLTYEADKEFIVK